VFQHPSEVRINKASQPRPNRSAEQVRGMYVAFVIGKLVMPPVL
jgi:hypothetical protein